jgi:hypothetical protein
VTTTTTNPGRTDPSTHPLGEPFNDPSVDAGSLAERQAWLEDYCSRLPGAVPARLAFRWAIENENLSTVALRVEGRRRLRALGDRHGFMPVWDRWSIEGCWLRVEALVAWWPAVLPAGRLDLVDEPVEVAA